jgi:integrase/recombinase XerD
MSTLIDAVKDYLSLRRRLGYKMADAGRWLPDFVSFLERQGAEHITNELALRWAMQPVGTHPAHWAARLRAVRLFAEYHKGVDPQTEIPPQGLLPHRRNRPQPYIYKDNEIAGLIQEAKKLTSKTGLRSHTYSTLLGLLAVTGIRVGEALALNQGDVDLAQGILTIRQGKFNKTRLVPIHSSTQEVLRGYACLRDIAFPNPKILSFFLSEAGSRLEISCVYRTFVKISRRMGLRGPHDSHGPRFHDLRHSFAVRTVIEWYRAGMDVDSQMPKLSTYLGHAHVSDTYWYLSAVPELLCLAAARLGHTKGGTQP